MTGQIIAPFQMTANRIKGFTIANEFVTLEGEENLKHQLDVDCTIEDVKDHNSNWIGIVSLTVSITVISEEEKKLSCHLILEGCFVSPVSDISKEDFHVFLKANGCASLYSIARSIIMSITSQALAGGQIILPMINVHKFLEDKDKRKRETISQKP